MEFMRQGTIHIFPKPDFDIKSIEHAWDFIGREIHEYTVSKHCWIKNNDIMQECRQYKQDRVRWVNNTRKP